MEPVVMSRAAAICTLAATFVFGGSCGVLVIALVSINRREPDE
jgi:hypothetical protein